MPKSNRADYTGLYAGIGIDPTGAGPQVADGLQPVLVAQPVFPPRRVYAVTSFLRTAPGAGLHNIMFVQFQVPSIIRHLSFDSGTNGTTASVFFAASAGVAGATVAGPQSAYPSLPARNVVSFDSTAAPVTTQFLISEGTGTSAATWEKMGLNNLGYPVDGNVTMQFPDPTANAITFFSIVWEEQLAGAV